MKPVEYSQYLSSVEEIINEARNGRMFILVDDEDRENEGDLVIPAQMATPDAVNFMATHGRGLICLAMTQQRVKQLGLELMTRENASRHQTAFTVSIEAREGVSTGISASDRAHTVATAIDATKGADDIATPGHVFPLMAREGGVLVRAGHTEAGVDIARLSGLNPSAVICEIMRDDGTMARMPDLVSFAQRHNLKIATIAQLIAYRLRHDRIIKAELRTTLPTYDCGEFNTVLYQNIAQPGEYLALTKGNVAVASEEPVLVRMHAMNAFDDIFSPARSRELHGAMRIIAEAGRGVIVILRDHSPRVLSERLRAHIEDRERPSVDLREYGIGAQILLDLGVRKMTLLSNHRHNIIGLEGYGLSVVEQRPIPLDIPQLKAVKGSLRESG